MKLVDQTLLTVAGTSGRWYEAELYRLKADLIVSTGGSQAAAEACYETAMAVAMRQGALPVATARRKRSCRAMVHPGQDRGSARFVGSAGGEL